MTEGWTPKIIKNETISDITSTLKDVVTKTIMEFYSGSLKATTTVLTTDTETRVRLRLSFINENRSPSQLTSGIVAERILEGLKERSIDHEKFVITSKINSNKIMNNYIDFIITPH